MPTQVRSGGVIAALVLCACASLASAQEQAPSADDFLAQTVQESTLEWLWGEASAVDAAAGTVTVKYLDYETDTEQEMVVATDSKTTFENAASVADILPGDTLSIDYTAGSGGPARARNISVEKAVPDDDLPGIEKLDPEIEEITGDQEIDSAPEMSSVPVD